MFPIVGISLREMFPHAEPEDYYETEFGLMGANKTKRVGSLGAGMSLVRVLLGPQYRGLVLCVVIAAGAIGFSMYAWRRWGEPATQGSEYVVTPESILVTPQPSWIHGNVKDEVIRTAAFSELGLLDRELVERVAHAFALHPWVKRVVRVEKRHPAQVAVELEFRRPVIVVKLDAPDEQGLLFLDEESVLLPSGDFAPSQARNYLRIGAAGETPTSVYGTAWGSERIAGAARIAAAWGDQWQALGLYWIVGVRSSAGELTYELRTQDDKARVVWGPAIGRESASEAPAGQKIAALAQFVNDKGPLGKSGEEVVIDLRELTASDLK
jgi:hypothetical protein